MSLVHFTNCCLRLLSSSSSVVLSFPLYYAPYIEGARASLSHIVLFCWTLQIKMQVTWATWGGWLAAWWPIAARRHRCLLLFTTEVHYDSTTTAPRQMDGWCACCCSAGWSVCRWGEYSSRKVECIHKIEMVSRHHPLAVMHLQNMVKEMHNFVLFLRGPCPYLLVACRYMVSWACAEGDLISSQSS